jgi:hypothetical protein
MTRPTRNDASIDRVGARRLLPLRPRVVRGGRGPGGRMGPPPAMERPAAGAR